MIRINLASRKGPALSGAGATGGEGGTGLFSSLGGMFQRVGGGGTASSSAAVQELTREVGLKILLVVLVYFGAQTALDSKREEELGVVRGEADTLSAEVARLDEAIGRMSQYEAEKKNIEDYEKVLKSKLDAISELMADRDSSARMFAELSSLLPKELWLTEFGVDGGRVRFKGSALNIEIATDFLSRVNSSPNFQDGQARMGEVADPLTGRSLQEFDIVASRKGVSSER